MCPRRITPTPPHAHNSSAFVSRHPRSSALSLAPAVLGSGCPRRLSGPSRGTAPHTSHPVGQVWAALKPGGSGEKRPSPSTTPTPPAARVSPVLVCSVCRVPREAPHPLTLDSCPPPTAHQSLPLTPSLEPACPSLLPLACPGPPRECGGPPNTPAAKLQPPHRVPPAPVVVFPSSKAPAGLPYRASSAARKRFQLQFTARPSG